MTGDPLPLAAALLAMAHNNAWANHRLLGACLALTPDEFAARRTGFFPSIRATLNHILVVDRFYVDAMEGGSLGPAALDDPEPCRDPASLHVAQRAVDERLIAFCRSLDDRSAAATVRVHRGERVQEERADRLLLHLFQHDIHHRGQAHAMVSGTGVPPPQLDEFFSAEEAPLRRADFEELGWTESTPWGGPNMDARPLRR